MPAATIIFSLICFSTSVLTHLSLSEPCYRLLPKLYLFELWWSDLLNYLIQAWVPLLEYHYMMLNLLPYFMFYLFCHSAYNIFTASQRSCGKVMFSQVLCLSMGEGGVISGARSLPGYWSHVLSGGRVSLVPRSLPGPWSFLGVGYRWSPGYPTPNTLPPDTLPSKGTWDQRCPNPSRRDMILLNLPPS